MATPEFMIDYNLLLFQIQLQITYKIMQIITKSLLTCFSTIPTRHSFKIIGEEDINFFRTFLKPHNIITDPHQIDPFNTSWFKTQKGSSKLVVTPESTQQVSQILSYCYQNNIAVVPQGGNTGLVGGSVPVFDQIVLSMRNMNKIHRFSELSSVVTLEAGVILEKANEYVKDYGCEFPLDLGAKGTCQVGGNAATNAGGIYMIKHGSFRSHILGMEAVLANGKILDMQSQIHKDNTGYDLKQLLIGSEGTLGVITKLNVHCPKRDENKTILLFKANKFQQILKSLPELRKKLGQDLTALEYVDGPTYNIASKHLGIDLMNVSSHQHLLFVETTSQDIEGIVDTLSEFPEAIMSQNDQQFRKIWTVRESIATISAKEGNVFAYDISYDISSWEDMLKFLRNKYSKSVVLGYGHIGDGNIHINICVKKNDNQTKVDDVQIFEKVAEKQGSISAEHGVGLHKPNFLHIQKSPQILYLYRQIKQTFDPKGILNPYKVVP